MTTFQPISTLADLETLDDGEVMAGYIDFQKGDPEPGMNRGRSYWHGWMNAARDHYERPTTPESVRLAHEYLERRRA